MSNEIDIDGSSNITIQGVGEGANVEVTQILAKSHEYNGLLNELRKTQELFDLQPEENTERRLQLSAEINHLTRIVEQIKRDVITLAATFDKLEINTERLKQAKEFFEKGDIGEARALLNDDNEIIEDEENVLWAKRDYYQKEIELKLVEKAEERLIQALLNQTDYTNPNRLADTRRYFERSIKSYENKFTIFLYAKFLQEHNHFNEAEKSYAQLLTNFANQLSSDYKAATLNNLAILHAARNENEKAFKEIKEALEIYRKLAKTKPDTYLKDVALSLNNLANMHSEQTRYEEALKAYRKALKIRRALAEINPDIYLPDVADTLNNLAILHQNLNKYEEALKEHGEALEIRRALAETNPNVYLKDVATSLTNLTILHQIQNQYEEDLEYDEAVQIYRKLAETNPDVYLPYVAATLNNLAGLHWKQRKYDITQNEIKEASEIYRALAEVNPDVYLPDVAMTLNNFASLLVHKGAVKEASQKFEESIEIYRALAVTNYQKYFPFLGGSLTNLALFYRKEVKDEKKSIDYAIEVMSILLPHIEKVPFTQKFYVDAWTLLISWGLSDEEIDQLIAEKMKENSQTYE